MALLKKRRTLAFPNQGTQGWAPEKLFIEAEKGGLTG
jgi:hypothetical protein